MEAMVKGLARIASKLKGGFRMDARKFSMFNGKPSMKYTADTTQPDMLDIIYFSVRPFPCFFGSRAAEKSCR